MSSPSFKLSSSSPVSLSSPVSPSSPRLSSSTNINTNTNTDTNTNNTNNNNNNEIIVGSKNDPIAATKKLSPIVLGAVLLIAPILLISNFIWLLTDGWTITGLPIQKHVHKEVSTICHSKRYIQVFNGVCETNQVLETKASECMRWGTIDKNKWKEVNDNNIYFERYDYDTIKEVRVLWPYIKYVSILSTIISIGNMIIVLPLADFYNKIFYDEAQKICLLISTFACFVDMIVILYIFTLLNSSLILQSITWMEKVCRFRVQGSFGIFLLIVSTIFAGFSVIVSLYSHYRLFIFNNIEIIKIDCVAPLPPEVSEIVKDKDIYKYDLLPSVIDKHPTLQYLPESATKEKLKQILRENSDSDDSDDEFYKHVKFQIHHHHHHQQHNNHQHHHHHHNNNSEST